MKNYKGESNTKVLNDFLYLIKNLFIGKEIIRDRNTFHLYMGMKSPDIELPNSDTEYLVNRTGLFIENGGDLTRSIYVLKSRDEINIWMNSQVNNYLLNSIDVNNFIIAIKLLRRLENFKKLGL